MTTQREPPFKIPWQPARFIECTGSERAIVHIQTPEFIKGPRSLFTCHDPHLLCGAGALGRAGGNAEMIVHTTIPYGYTLCNDCVVRVRYEFLPFTEED